MSTPTHIALLALLDRSIIPALTRKGNLVVTGNVNEPGVYEVRAFTRRGGYSTYPVATLRAGNPHIYAEYKSRSTNAEMEGILSSYPEVLLPGKKG